LQDHGEARCSPCSQNAGESGSRSAETPAFRGLGGLPVSGVVRSEVPHLRRQRHRAGPHDRVITGSPGGSARLRDHGEGWCSPCSQNAGGSGLGPAEIPAFRGYGALPIRPRACSRGVCGGGGKTSMVVIFTCCEDDHHRSNVVRRRPTLPHRNQCSTIGAGRLSFRVRNGTGRFPAAMIAVTLWKCQSCHPPIPPVKGGECADRISGTVQWTRTRSYKNVE
jgi:hypothetical protein